MVDFLNYEFEMVLGSDTCKTVVFIHVAKTLLTNVFNCLPILTVDSHCLQHCSPCCHCMNFLPCFPLEVCRVTGLCSYE